MQEENKYLMGAGVTEETQSRLEMPQEAEREILLDTYLGYDSPRCHPRFPSPPTL